jgi:hypothetical protein
MNDFLDAECVMDALFSGGVFTKKLWKLDKVTANSYDVGFEFTDSARIAGFTVFIKGTYHCIGLTALLNHSRRFNILVAAIISSCALPKP